MTKAAWFNNNGKFNFWDSDQQPGEVELNDSDGDGGHYVKADIDENMALWRFTYNYETNSVDVYVDYYDSSTTTAKALAHTVAVPADSSLNPIGGKLVLEAGDQLRAWASADADAEIVVSVLEIT